jgi:hypothetical protein
MCPHDVSLASSSMPAVPIAASTAAAPAPSARPDITIRETLGAFLEDRGRTLAPPELRLYQRVLFFLQYCVNNQAHRNLDEGARAHYERLYHESDGTKQFDDIFGPERLLSELADFADVYIRKQIHTSDRVADRAKEIVADLREWLKDSGLVPFAAIREQESREPERRRLRRRLTRLVRAVERRLVTVEPAYLPDEDYVPGDYHLISRIEGGRIWLRVFRSAHPEEIGPIFLSRAHAERLRVGWNLCCGLGRLRGRWQIVELEEIHPRG